MQTSERIDDLEHRVALLERRVTAVGVVDRRYATADDPSPPTRPAQPTATPTQPQFKRPAQRTAPATAPRRARPPLDAARLEELFGGRVLAWVGAIAVLTG